MSSVYLLGFRGAGKTTLGAALARDLGRRFLDLDQVWEARRGQGILDFVRAQGLAEFRRTEEALLAEIDAEVRSFGAPPAVIALGGGVVDHEPSRVHLEQSPVPKIYLRVPAPELWRRLATRPERLEIGGLTSEAALAELLERRRPHFEKIATYTVENRDINEGLRELKKLVTAM